MKKTSALSTLLLWTLLGGMSSVHAAAPSGYYDSCEGKSGRSLLTALYNVISDHTDIGYGGLWTLYKTSDTREDGTIWDMYSTVKFKYKTDQCGNYEYVGDCYNREHSMPKSWFNDDKPMHNDAFHIYPTDGLVNNQRSNYPYGECADGRSLSSQALGKLGQSTFPGYSGTVFEPDDQYKGDFARSYFYMATCYNNRISSWDSDMLAHNSYPCFSDWALNLLLKWHRQDPVSEKETRRNDAVYAAQHNRNPFIDHPELVEYVWGDKTTSGWVPGGVVEPEIVLPTDGSVVDMGVTAIGVKRSVAVTVKGEALDADVSVSVSGTGFSIDRTTVGKAEAGKGGVVTVSYLSDAVVANATGTLTLVSGDSRVTVSLRASAIDGLPVEKPSAVTAASFVIKWVDIDQKDGAAYTVSVYRDGSLIDGYPVSVPASQQRYEVTGLEPNTEYTYTVASSALTSEVMTVKTAELLPDIQFDNILGLALSTVPGEPSEPVEVSIIIENIAEPVTIGVKAPFQVSTDKSTWAETTTLNPDEDRFYLRLGACDGGIYTTSITARAGDYMADSEEITGRSSSEPSFFEDFEKPSSLNGYDGGEYQGSAATWLLVDAGIYSDANSNGEQSVRFGKKAGSSIAMTSDKAMGAGVVTCYAAKWSNDDDAVLQVEYSTDGGATWSEAGEAVALKTSAWTKYTVTVNVTGNVRLKFQQKSGRRLNLDDVTISDYAFSGMDDSRVASTWDAYCRGGELVVETASTSKVYVYGVDGIGYFTGDISGRQSIALPAGFYVVVVGDTSRRVLVR